jgi:four helix bundle protein
MMNDESKPQQDLSTRTRKFGVRIVRMFTALPKSDEARVLGMQVLRSGTSVGAHYREGHRARSTAEFISKIETALQELDETGYWIDLLVDCEIVPEKRLKPLRQEIDELTAIFVASVRTAKKRK